MRVIFEPMDLIARLTPRIARVASAFLAMPGRFAGTIERRLLATIACLLICRGGSQGATHRRD